MLKIKFLKSPPAAQQKQESIRMSKKKILVKYTNRDFNSIKSDLEEHARIYYPDTYKDFSENSFGSYVLDAVSYVGDMLSFYLDYQVNESFLETAIEYQNVRRLAKRYGYKFSGRPIAYGFATFYVIVPSNTSGLGPDMRYVPVLKTGTELSSDAGTSFVLTEDVDFSNPKNQVVAARFSDSTSKPVSWAIRAIGQIKSSIAFRTQVDVDAFTRFQRIRIGEGTISEVVSVIDSQGNEYFQVDHLAQDVIYVETVNPNVRADGVRSILKPKIVSRRFVVDQDESGTYLQFGYGTDIETTTTNIADPSQIALRMNGRPYISDYAFDPTKLLDSNTLGIGPANTTLTVVYNENTGDSVNLSAGSINSVSFPIVEFPNRESTSSDSVETEVQGSMETTNEEPIVGNTSVPTAEEIRYRAYCTYAAQNRAVTKNDYEAFVYMMPSKFGSIKRVNVVNDPSGTSKSISLYVIGESSDGNLITLNDVAKQNLKVWLNKNKMINDRIDIYDAKIVNIGFDFEAVVDSTSDKTQVLADVYEALQLELQDKMYVGEPFYITNVYNIINKVTGIIDVRTVKMKLMRGTKYSSAPVSILELQSQDGTYLRTPQNVILEILDFNTDIRGIVQ